MRKIGILDIQDTDLSLFGDMSEPDVLKLLKWINPAADLVDNFSPLENVEFERRPRLGPAPTPAGWVKASGGWEQIARKGGLALMERQVLDTSCKADMQKVVGTAKRRPYARQWIVTRGKPVDALCG